jgi:hypothetical protein
LAVLYFERAGFSGDGWVYGGSWMRMPLMIFTTIVTSFRV